MQQVWRKRWRQSGWIALGAVTLVLLVAAISKKNNKVCNGIEVSINGDGNNYFIDEKGVAAVLKATRPIKGEAIENIDLITLEGRLKQDKWIADAQLYFDNKQMLQVMIEEKEPVARIFTSAGSSFYIDSACRKLPLSDKLSARIPMFTSFPSDRNKLSPPDSELLASAKELALFIQSDDFWKAQVSQIDITPEGFEMIPTIGNHVVELGKDGNWKQKFDRLFSFYKQVWTKVGFERYEKLNVQFDGQVVATVKGAKPSIIDSAKAILAFENLMAKTKKAEDSAVNLPVRPKVVKGTIEDRSVNIQSTTVAQPAMNKTIVAKEAAKKAPAKQEPAKNNAATNRIAANNVEVKPVPKAIMKKKAPNPKGR